MYIYVHICIYVADVTFQYLRNIGSIFSQQEFYDKPDYKII